MLPRLQRRGHSLNVAEVVGPKGVVVTSAERGPRLDHFRHATRTRVVLAREGGFICE